MKKILLSIFILLFFISISYAATYTLQFAWDANTEQDLAGYRLYQTETSQFYDPNLYYQIDDPNATTYVLLGVQGNRILYFVLTAFDEANNNSDYSNEVTFEPDSNAPDAPINLRIQEMNIDVE